MRNMSTRTMITEREGRATLIFNVTKALTSEISNTLVLLAMSSNSSNVLTLIMSLIDRLAGNQSVKPRLRKKESETKTLKPSLVKSLDLASIFAPLHSSHVTLI